MIKLLFLLLISLTTFQDFIEHEKFVKTDIQDERDIIYYEFEGELFYMKKNIEMSGDSSSIKIFSLNQSDYKYSIELPLGSPAPWGFMSFALSDKYIVLTTGRKSYIYENLNGKFQFKNLVSFIYEQSFEKQWIKGDTIVYFDNMYYSAKEKTNKDIVFGKYYIPDSALTYKPITNIDCMKMANNNPRKIVDYDMKSDRTFVSDIFNYKIRIYKYNTLIDSLVLNKSFWKNDWEAVKQYDTDKSEDASKKYKSNLMDLYSLGLKSYQIVTIDYINNDKLFIVWNGSSEDNQYKGLHIDLWDLSKKPFKCIHENVTFFRGFNKELLVKESSIINGNTFEIFPSGRIVYRSYDPVNISEPKYQNMIMKDYKIYTDSLLEAQEDLKVTLNVFRMKI